MGIRLRCLKLDPRNTWGSRLDVPGQDERVAQLRLVESLSLRVRP